MGKSEFTKIQRRNAVKVAITVENIEAKTVPNGDETFKKEFLNDIYQSIY